MTATRDLVSIGQHWQRRARRAQERRTMRIRQIHRADRTVELDDGGGRRMLVTFTELRRGWRLA